MEFSELSLLEALCSECCFTNVSPCSKSFVSNAHTPLPNLFAVLCFPPKSCAPQVLVVPQMSLQQELEGSAQCHWPPAVLQHSLLYSSRNDTVLCTASPVLTSSGGRTGVPKSLEALRLWRCAGASQVL